MTAVIIAGFPGVGKSISSNSEEKFIDSDSSYFSWDRDDNGEIRKDKDNKNIRHPDWPKNYMNHIKEEMEKVDVIFVSSHAEVRKALVDAGIRFSLVYPERKALQEYLKRYEMRGSSLAFITLIRGKWDEFLSELEHQEGCTHHVLREGQFLSDVLDTIRPSTSPAVPPPKLSI